jgi:uncharacterized protein YjdB
MKKRTLGLLFVVLLIAVAGFSFNQISIHESVFASTIKIAAPQPTATAGDSKVTLKWTAVAKATAYRVYSYDAKTKAYTRLATLSGSTLTYTKSGLNNGTKYTYLVRGFNGVSGSAYTAANQVSAMPIAAPKLAATAGDAKVTLKWSAVVGATEYRVYSYNASTKNYTRIATPSASTLTYTQTGLTNGKNYTFLVRGFNGISASAYTAANYASAKPIAAPILTASAGDSHITLNWTAVAGATEYRVYSYNATTKTYTRIATPSASTLTYTQTGLTNGKTYTYLVLGFNGVSASAYTAADQASAIPNIPVSSITVISAGNAASVVSGGTLQMNATITPANATFKTVTWSVAPGTGSATISVGGLLTANGAGTVTVTATNVPSGVSGNKVITVTAIPVTPAAPFVIRDDTANTVSGMTTAMEYNLDGAGYVLYNATTFNAIDFGGNHTLLVRVAAEGINPAGLDTMLTFTTNPVTPTAPAVTRDDTANTVSGMTTAMEYNLDGAGYVLYNATTFDAIDLSGNHTLLVRVASEGINPFGPDTTLTFTTNPVPVTPAAPAVTRNDTTNTVTGMATGMEYNLDGAGYVAYVAGTFNGIDFSGNHTLLVRYAAEGINPVGPDTTLTFTANPILNSIAITTPATKTTYAVGDVLNITGLVVTGTYSDNSTAVVPITGANITGFNTSSPLTGQVLTITVDGKTATYTINIIQVILSKTMTSVILGNSDTISATVLPIDDANQSVIWSVVSGSNSATVNNGLITGVKLGIATVTATTIDGVAKASCFVTVTNAANLLNNFNLATMQYMPGLILQFGDAVGMNLTDYNKLNADQQAAVQQTMVDASFATVADIKAVFDQAVISVILDAINYATVDTMGAALEANTSFLGLTDYNMLSMSEKTIVHGRMLLPVYFGVHYTSFAEVQATLDLAVTNAAAAETALAEINAATVATIGDSLVNNAVILGLSLDNYNLYGDLATLNATLESQDFTNAYDLQVVIDSIVLGPVWEIDYADMSTMATAIANNATALGLDLTDYNALSPEEQVIVHGYLVYKTYFVNWFSSIPEVQAAFNMAVTNAPAASIALAEINSATVDMIDEALASNAGILGIDISSYDPSMNAALVDLNFTNTLDLQFAVYGW